MKIVLTEPLGISNELLETYQEKLTQEGHSFVSYDSKANSEEELYERAKDADILMIANHPLPDKVISRLPHLKMIDVAFTGVDHVGLKTCLEKDILVCNASGYSNTSVSELVIGQVLGLYRKLLACDEACRNEKNSSGLTGLEISGKTVGIIGTGKIGIETAKLFKAFGAKVIGWSRSKREEAIDIGLEYVELDELLAQSDIISLHLPMNEKTKHFFDASKINKMKSSAILVNCARGGVVDNVALAQALNEGQIAGAAIDVFDVEPPLSLDYPLLNAKNCLLTPHVAFLTKESMIRRAEIVFENLQAYLLGSPINVVQ